MKYKIGVYGSAINEGKGIEKKAIELGKILAQYNLIIITGAGHGVPYQIAQEAAKYGAEIWGFPPVIDSNSQKEYAKNDEINFYKKTFFVPKNLPFSTNLQANRQYRNFISTYTCDAGIIISGRWGTMNEFTNLHGMDKIIGILTESGGTADELPQLIKKINKPSNAKMIFNSSPKNLVNEILSELEKRTYALSHHSL